MSPNQRQFHRCPLAAEQPAVLVVDRRKIDARVIEMSLGGFGVMVPRSLPVIKDPLARLKVRGLDYVVRITRQEDRDGGVLLAVEQIEEIVPSSTVTGSSVVGRWMTFAAWTVAVGLVVAAFYSLSVTHAADSLSRGF